jgi:hypothetical protein
MDLLVMAVKRLGVAWGVPDDKKARGRGHRFISFKWGCGSVSTERNGTEVPAADLHQTNTFVAAGHERECGFALHPGAGRALAVRW